MKSSLFPTADDSANADDSQAGPADDSVEAFVDAQLGLEVMTAFGRKSRGRKTEKPPLFFELTRELDIDDALALQQAPVRTVGEVGGTASVQRLRTIHHQIARMLVTGEKQVSISRSLGITPARIQQLKNDPAFQELLAHYESLEQEAEINLKERFYLLGTAAMEELQERLLDAPDSFGNGHLMELTKLTVGGEAPRQAPVGKAAPMLDAETVARLKADADRRQQSAVEIRKEHELPTPSETEGDGETKSGEGLEVGDAQPEESVSKPEGA